MMNDSPGTSSGRKRSAMGHQQTVQNRTLKVRKSETFGYSANCTPYLSRQEYTFYTGSDSVNEADVDRDFQYLAKTKWMLYKSSPLYNFSYSEKCLRRYSRKLTEELARQADDSNNEKQYETEFLKLCKLKTTAVDPDGVLIKVNSKTKNQEEKLLYVGFFTSQGAVNRKEHGFVHLPLVLCKGNTKITSSVHRIIMKFFDCVISPLIVPHSDMKWLNCIYMCFEETGDSPVVEWHLQNMADFLNKDSLIIKLHIDDMEELWSSVHNYNFDGVRAKEVHEFHEVLERHMLRTMNFNISRFSIFVISVPEFVVAFNGKMYTLTLYTLEAARRLLPFFHELSCVLDTPTPALSEIAEDTLS